MSHRLYRSISKPIRDDLTWDKRWTAKDQRLIHCWELGRRLSEKESDVAASAQAGELPVLHWKGGVEKKLKVKEKYGTLSYLAHWQGLRGEDLENDLSSEHERICTRTEMKVIFTGDANKHTASSGNDE